MKISITSLQNPTLNVNIQENNIDTYIGITSTLNFFKDFLKFDTPVIETGREIAINIKPNIFDEVVKSLDYEEITVGIRDGSLVNVYSILSPNDFAKGMQIADNILRKLELDDGALGSGSLNSLIDYPKDGRLIPFALDGYPKPTGGIKIIRDLTDIESDEEETNQNDIDLYYA